MFRFDVEASKNGQSVHLYADKHQSGAGISAAAVRGRHRARPADCGLTAPPDPSLTDWAGLGTGTWKHEDRLQRQITC